MRSYAAAVDAAGGGFRGSAAGAYSVDRPTGRGVVGPDGNEIAWVSDLAVESGDRPRKVIVDVGGFLGIGAEPVALGIAGLRQRRPAHLADRGEAAGPAAL